MDQARAELGAIARQIDQDQPGRTTTVSVVPATLLSLPVARRDVFGMAWLVAAAFGLLLLIACANVANLLLARAVSRRKEIAVRLALGAKRGRLVRQLLTESGLIALAGGAAGSVLAWWGFQALASSLLPALGGSAAVLRVDGRPNGTALWFALALTAVTTVVFGLVPALQASGQDVHGVMKQDDMGSGGRLGWLRSFLIGVQAAVCALLLILTGLLLRTLYAAHTVDPGFDARRVTVVSYDFARAPVRRRERRRLPAASRRTVVGGAGDRGGGAGDEDADERWTRSNEFPPRARRSRARRRREHGLAGVLRGGRHSDRARPHVHAVRARGASARRHRHRIHGAPGTGRGRIRIGRSILMSSNAPLEIVGVAADAQVSPVAAVMSSYLYLLAGPADQRRLGVLVRSQVEPASLQKTLRAVTQELDPGILVRVAPLEANLDIWRRGSRAVAGLSAVLSLLALLLASAGVYGVVSYVVSRRRREVAIPDRARGPRLRAPPADSGADAAPGHLRARLRHCRCAALGSRALDRVLFGVSRLDPVAFVASPLVLLAVASLAAIVPMAPRGVDRSHAGAAQRLSPMLDSIAGARGVAPVRRRRNRRKLDGKRP